MNCTRRGAVDCLNQDGQDEQDEQDGELEGELKDG